MNRRTIAALVWIAGCGPEGPADATWMLGVYSSEEQGLLDHNVSQVARYEIREGGEFVVEFDRRCGTSETERRTYAWEHAGDGAIEVEFPEDGERWRLTPGEDCNRIEIARSGEQGFGEAYSYPRGAVCVRPEPCGPESGECFCETYWCDEAPPACADEAP